MPRKVKEADDMGGGGPGYLGEIFVFFCLFSIVAHDDFLSFMSKLFVFETKLSQFL